MQPRTLVACEDLTTGNGSIVFIDAHASAAAHTHGKVSHQH